MYSIWNLSAVWRAWQRRERFVVRWCGCLAGTFNLFSPLLSCMLGNTFTYDILHIRNHQIFKRARSDKERVNHQVFVSSALMEYHADKVRRTSFLFLLGERGTRWFLCNSSKCHFFAYMTICRKWKWPKRSFGLAWIIKSLILLLISVTLANIWNFYLIWQR